MAYTTYHHVTAAPGILERAWAWLAARVRGIGAFYAEEGRLAQLAALDNRTLHDIGLHRSELTSIVHHHPDDTRRA